MVLLSGRRLFNCFFEGNGCFLAPVIVTSLPWLSLGTAEFLLWSPVYLGAGCTDLSLFLCIRSVWIGYFSCFGLSFFGLGCGSCCVV